MRKTRTAFASILITMAFFSGCGLVRVTKKKAETKVITALPVLKAPDKQQAVSANKRHTEFASKGSLWHGDQSRSFFFKDAKASLVGDIVTVHVIENAKGSKDAKTKSGRSSSLTASTASFLGLPTETVSDFQLGTKFSNAFDGNGATSRSGSLTADVTAIVVAVFANGNMRIEGRREVLINNEREYLSISGIIRPEDIGTGNTVFSTVIADAKIEYSGKGVLNDKQKPGWLAHFIDVIWPF